MKYDRRNQGWRNKKKEYSVNFKSLYWTKGKIIPEVYFLDGKKKFQKWMFFYSQ